jgi:hypothetical protein
MSPSTLLWRRHVDLRRHVNGVANALAMLQRHGLGHGRLA